MSQEQNDTRPPTTLSLLDLVAVFLRYRWLIGTATLVAAVAVVIYALISLRLPPEESYLPNTYQSRAILLVNEPSSSSNLSSLLSSSGIPGLSGIAGGAAGQSYGQLAQLVLQGKPLLDQLVADMNLVQRAGITENVRHQSRQLLLEKGSFSYAPDTSTLSIAFTDTDPEFARDLTNRTVELLQDRFRSIGGNRARTRRELLENKVAEVETRINELQGEIQAFQQRYGVYDVQSLVSQQVRTVAEMRAQLIRAEMELETFAEYAPSDDPAIRRLRSERDQLREIVRELERGYSRYDQVLPSRERLPEIAYEYAELERDLQVQQRIYENLRSQLEVARLNVEGEEPIFQVFELGEVPEVKSGPSRGTMSIIVTIAAFFLSTFLAFILEYARRVKQDPEERGKLREALARKD